MNVVILVKNKKDTLTKNRMRNFHTTFSAIIE